MAYATTNPPIKLTQGIGGSNSGTLWHYSSEDVSTDVDAAGYFTNGGDLGMKTGDVVMAVETDNTFLLTIHSVTVVSSTAPGATTVSGAI